MLAILQSARSCYKSWWECLSSNHLHVLSGHLGCYLFLHLSHFSGIVLLQPLLCVLWGSHLHETIPSLQVCWDHHLSSGCRILSSIQSIWQWCLFLPGCIFLLCLVWYWPLTVCFVRSFNICKALLLFLLRLPSTSVHCFIIHSSLAFFMSLLIFLPISF